jgi:UPF0716 family protein affecting phage T7 exclusion
MISSTIAGEVGGLSIFLEIIFSAIFGITILKNFKFSLMESIEKARTSKMTQEEFLKTNVSRAIAALFLIIPGFFTDILGILMLIGFLPYIVTKLFKFKKPIQTKYYNSSFNNTTYKKEQNNEIIDVEIIDDSKSIK